MRKYLDIKEFLIAKYKKIPFNLGVGLVIAAAILLLFLGYYGWGLTPAKLGNKSFQVFKVPYGASVKEIGGQLKRRHFIRNKFIYEVYVRLNPRWRMAKAGYYRLSSGMSVPAIVRELRRGIPPSIRVTVPEGLTIREVADLLARKGLVNRESFINKTKNNSLIAEVLAEYNLNLGAEGYLFPDTYNFELTGTVENEIISKMLARFKEVFQKNFPQIPVFKRKEIVIIASLVEKEAKEPAERQIIAGVFYNRLRLGYPLQSCATVQYSLGKHKDRLSYKDLQVNSPYNTYLHRGLPPGPIASPGLASLKAAVFPAHVKYLYFVAKPDGTHVFSTTYEQHISAQHKILKML